MQQQSKYEILKINPLKEEQEEIDDDEEQALAQRSSSSTEHGLITISQYRSAWLQLFKG